MNKSAAVSETASDDEIIEQMFAIGAHYAYSKSRRHPSMKPFIFGLKNKVEIIDLEKTRDMLSKAKTFVENLGREKKVLLFVSGKREAREIIMESAETVAMPYVNGRWIGGTFTNFTEIKKRIEKFENLQSMKQKGELSKYTKKEQLLIDKEISNLNEMFSGIVLMKKIPDAMFVVDSKQEKIAVMEAKKVGVPVLALMSSDCDINDVDYPIVANDSSQSSIRHFVHEIMEAYKSGLKMSLPVSQEFPADGDNVKVRI